MTYIYIYILPAGENVWGNPMVLPKTFSWGAMFSQCRLKIIPNTRFHQRNSKQIFHPPNNGVFVHKFSISIFDSFFFDNFLQMTNVFQTASSFWKYRF